MNHALNNNKVSCFTHKHSLAKLLPIRQLMNVLPRLKFLNAITAFTPLTSFLINLFTANKIYLHGARSGFETESPVHIRTRTWNAGDKFIFLHLGVNIPIIKPRSGQSQTPCNTLINTALVFLNKVEGRSEKPPVY